MLFFAGPAQVGQSVSYQITGALSTQAAPRVSKLVLSWTAPTRLYARLTGSGANAAVSITRADNGVLSVATSGSGDAAAVAALLNQLNFPGTLATRLNGSDHAQTTLSIVPLAPAPTSTSVPVAQQSPGPVTVPVNLDLVYDGANASSTLIADGNSMNRNGPADSGFGRRGGGMGGGMGGMGGGWMGGGGRSRDSDQSGDASTPKPPTGFALEALFDQSGSLQHATFREYFASTTKGAQSIEETFTIDRIDK